MIPIDQQYKKLEALVLRASTFLWNGEQEYTGFTCPRGICKCTRNSTQSVKYYFVLAEDLVRSDVMDYDGEYQDVILLVELKENLDFSFYFHRDRKIGWLKWRRGRKVEKIPSEYGETWEWLYDRLSK